MNSTERLNVFLPVGSDIKPLRFPWVTVAWILVCLATFFLITRPELQRAYQETITYGYAVVPSASNELWKYFAYQFFHSSLGHLLSNIWYFAIFGWIVESLLGARFFFIFALVAGALAVVPEQIFQVNPSLPVVGASGAVAFAIGALVGLRPQSQIKFWLMILPVGGFPNTLMVPIRYLVYFWLILQVSGLAMNQWLAPESVAYATHLTGFAIGALVGLAWRPRSTTLVDSPLVVPEKA